MKNVLWWLLFSFCLVLTSASAQEISPNSIEQAVLNEINTARKNPKVYIGYLEEYRQKIKGKTVHYPNGVTMETLEGMKAVDDAINFFKNSCQTRFL